MAIAHKELPLWGVQFHPESILTEHGKKLLKNFMELARQFNQKSKGKLNTISNS
ncbi:MAG: aminodeoxychorismate/anthranilate synthase component II, partial [Aquificae bacterium]|nr:aminodeoxychorismate/anthranilate synthase component II [Aquificota bacterium]